MNCILTEEKIAEFYKASQDQGTHGIAPSVHFALAIECYLLEEWQKQLQKKPE